MDYIYYGFGISALLTLGVTLQSSIYKTAAESLDQHNMIDYRDAYRDAKGELNRLKTLKEAENIGKLDRVDSGLITQLDNAVSWFQKANTVLSLPRELGEWENFVVSHKAELDTLKAQTAKYREEHRGRQPETELDRINLAKYDLLANLEFIRQEENRAAEFLHASKNANSLLLSNPEDDRLGRGFLGVFLGAIALALSITKVTARLRGHS